MSLELAMDLVLCGILLAGLGLFARRLEPDLPRVTLWAGLVGGGLCVLWGVWGRRAPRCRVGAMLTLAVAACVLAYQAVQSWRAPVEGDSQSRMVAGLMTVLVVFCIGTLANLKQAGKADRKEQSLVAKRESEDNSTTELNRE